MQKGNGAVRPVRDGQQLRARRRHTRILLLLRASERHARSSQSRLSAKQLAPREKTLREEVERRSRMSKSQQLLEEFFLRKPLSFFFPPLNMSDWNVSCAKRQQESLQTALEMPFEETSRICAPGFKPGFNQGNFDGRKSDAPVFEFQF